MYDIRTTFNCAILCSLLSLGSGCKKSDVKESQPAHNPEILSLHWMGMSRLSKETNAAGFLKIWRLAETEKLEAQTLDKLALGSWHLYGTNRPAGTNYVARLRENHPASLLR